MKNVSVVLAVGFMATLLMFLVEPPTAEAATCNPTELSPCSAALQSGVAPSGDCCSKLKEQTPCFCTYLNDPNLRKYINTPNAKNVAAACGVPYPPKC